MFSSKPFLHSQCILYKQTPIDCHVLSSVEQGAENTESYSSHREISFEIRRHLRTQFCLPRSQPAGVSDPYKIQAK